MKLTPEQAHHELGALLNQLGPALAPIYLAFHTKHKVLMCDMPASVNKHHSFPGGYVVHVYEVVRNLVSRLETVKAPANKLPGLAEAIIAAYVHDLDKLFWRYERDTEPPTAAQSGYARSLGIPLWEHETKATISKKIDAAKSGRPAPAPSELSVHAYRKDCPAADDSGAVMFLCQEHGLLGVTRNVLHAVSLHHGGWAPLAKTSTNLDLGPLAVLLHAADMESAQIQNGEI